MPLLDPLIGATIKILRDQPATNVSDLLDSLDDFSIIDQYATAIEDLLSRVGLTVQDVEEDAGQVVEAGSPIDEITRVVTQLAEEYVLADLKERGELTPENAQTAAADLDGASTSVVLGLGLAGSIIESISLGQIDKHQEYITQALAGLALDDTTGSEIEVRKSEGLAPALEAKVAKEHRSKFVALQDAVEYALRNKELDQDWLTRSGATDQVEEVIGSDDPVNPENLIEEWGLRDDQLQILEETGINAMEFEELIETPAELGLIVPDDVLDAELDRSGYSEQTKAFLRQVNSKIRESARSYQELLVTEELLPALDRLVEESVLSPRDAVRRVPDDVPVDETALSERFRDLRDLPPGSPTRSQVEGAFASGYLSLPELRTLLDQREFDVDQNEEVLRKLVLDELDGDLQTAVGLGLLGEGQYSDYAEVAGLDDQTVDALLSGQSLDDVAKQNLKESTSSGDRPVGSIVGIGESRARALDAVGVETVDDLAQADVEDVAETAQVSPETARQFINQASQRLD